MVRFAEILKSIKAEEIRNRAVEAGGRGALPGPKQAARPGRQSQGAEFDSSVPPVRPQRQAQAAGTVEEFADLLKEMDQGPKVAARAQPPARADEPESKAEAPSAPPEALEEMRSFAEEFISSSPPAAGEAEEELPDANRSEAGGRKGLADELDEVLAGSAVASTVRDGAEEPKGAATEADDLASELSEVLSGAPAVKPRAPSPAAKAEESLDELFGGAEAAKAPEKEGGPEISAGEIDDLFSQMAGSGGRDQAAASASGLEETAEDEEDSAPPAAPTPVSAHEQGPGEDEFLLDTLQELGIGSDAPKEQAPAAAAPAPPASPAGEEDGSLLESLQDMGLAGGSDAPKAAPPAKAQAPEKDSDAFQDELSDILGTKDSATAALLDSVPSGKGAETGEDAEEEEDSLTSELRGLLNEVKKGINEEGISDAEHESLKEILGEEVVEGESKSGGAGGGRIGSFELPEDLFKEE